MSDAEKILHDLKVLTKSIDLDRVELEVLTISPEVRLDMQHHIVRCIRSLRELEIALEGKEPEVPGEGDFLV